MKRSTSDFQSPSKKSHPSSSTPSTTHPQSVHLGYKTTRSPAMRSHANPGPLGLMGFGMSTLLLNLHNCQIFPLNSSILGLGLAFGGIAQLIAGMFEFSKGNTFGMTAFCAYGGFWISFVLTIIMPTQEMSTAPDNKAFGFYLLLWGIFTACMTISTLKLNKCLLLIFSTLTILFLMLAINKFCGEPKALSVASGVVGIICGALAFYTSIAEVTNDTYGRSVLPVGKPHYQEKFLNDDETDVY
eukprot:Blabericola_migrator_1__3808@NODE_2147_length_3206_cov_240_244982_g1359_i0_p2_GENE_NODE_2147_length_3206_cov_240_244982_g1359_i0NODE_2147_length_3206_cov_240_244982_g1359_i0_p2_ORF_typecomplete_len243_score35_65Gpr1_Fun34_YaaH/PF01184_19/1_9e55YwiC/PF14256_6/0_019Phage_holin_5_1/PF06946_11/6_4e02Phage_holin_5_1/PF06946_11/2_6e03Phage_holin_5_1/PF06946_11/0_17CPP1like/PF11833_8/2_9e02CPP1like/PF11833_8/0_75DUF1129/PF06570_11/62_NODE_2147_length_3206_cov_240_244982_g1359_i021252853